MPLPPDAELIAAVLEAVAEESNALIFRDPAMNRVLRLATQVATSDASVLITGESGTGKEIMARYIHAKSKRADRSFISVNCAAIPESLLESELFGHEKGAFTGAVSRRLGKFEEANRGTLLLDEISEMHPRLQAKLLRAVQEREIDRVGGSQPIKVDIRLLATSNRDLEEEVRQGNFREDLYFRLNVVNIELPPLRERQQDIEILAEHFIKKYAEANGVASPALAPRALDRLQRHHWRGNVRELENAMHRAVLLVEGDIIEPELILLSGRNLEPEDNGDSRPQTARRQRQRQRRRKRGAGRAHRRRRRAPPHPGDAHHTAWATGPTPPTSWAFRSAPYATSSNSIAKTASASRCPARESGRRCKAPGAGHGRERLRWRIAK